MACCASDPFKRSTGDERAVTGADRVDVRTVTCGVAKNSLVGNDLMMSTAARDAGLEAGALARPEGDLPERGSRYRRTGRAPDVVALPASREVFGRRSLTDSWARPVHAADMAQARLFDDILHDEIAELEDQAASAEARWIRRRERGIGDDKPPAALARLRSPNAQAQPHLDAQRDRFPSE